MKCRYCGCENIPEAVFCERCGKKLEAIEAEKIEERPEENKNIKICPVCFYNNTKEALFCQECGATLNQPIKSEKPKIQSKARSEVKKSARPEPRPTVSQPSRTTEKRAVASRKKRRKKKNILPIVIGFGLLGVVVALGILFLPKILNNTNQDKALAISSDTAKVSGFSDVEDSSEDYMAPGSEPLNAPDLSTPTDTPVPIQTPTPTPIPTSTPVPTSTPIPVSELNSANEYILPDVDSQYLTGIELQSMPPQVLRYARNEIYARHGRKFNSAELSGWFNQQSWYNGTISGDDFDESVLNDYEKENAKIIADIEGGRYELDQGDYSYADVYEYLEQREAAEANKVQEPFYGIWCEATKDYNEAWLYCREWRDSGFPSADVFLTSEWSNLNPEPWYAVTAGMYSSEDEAYNFLASVQNRCSDAYVKYSGSYIGY